MSRFSIKNDCQVINFQVSSFCGRLIIRENHKNFMPQKFPAIRYPDVVLSHRPGNTVVMITIFGK